MEPLACAFGCALLVGAGLSFSLLRARLLARRRLFASGEAVAEEASPHRAELSPLGLWLERAGNRSLNAPRVFVASCVASTFLGAAALLVLRDVPSALGGLGPLQGLPILGSLLGMVLNLLPWFTGAAMAALPILVVRAERRRRVAAIERDLPLALELLATLAEAGFGFDASVAKLVDSLGDDRAIHEELRRYQVESRTGMGRLHCLARLERRIDLPAVSSLVSALTQAEEVGAGLSGILRPQAEDLRRRRREDALARAEALPEKLVVPLLLGFLPGLLIWTLGPTIHQLGEMLAAALG